MKPKKLLYKDFLYSLKLSPRLVVELVIENSKGEILLVEREEEPHIGKWHLPGGFLLKGETIKDCATRVATNELKFALNYKTGEFEGLFENLDGDSRGHILHYVMRFKTLDFPRGNYFKKLPNNTIYYQKRLLNKIGYN